MRRPRRMSLHEKVGVFVLIPEKALGGRIPFGKRQMPGKAEASPVPRGDEFVRLMPSVKRDAEGIAAQHTKDFTSVTRGLTFLVASTSRSPQ